MMSGQEFKMMDQRTCEAMDRRAANRRKTLQQLVELCEQHAKADPTITGAMKWRSMKVDLIRLDD